MGPTTRRSRLVITGIVQGVGFRPYVHRLATELGLTGWVENDGSGVTIEVEGPARAVDRFAIEVVDRAPPLARVETVERVSVPLVDSVTFAILASAGHGPARTLVSPDVATCADCLTEVTDPTDRRYRYPFANCTNCGPRYTIVTGIPYDRPNTTMAGFPLCPECRAEYENPGDRRFHAQPVCCPRCGPHYSLDPVQVARALEGGDVVAVKGLGGYHLMATADDEAAVARLRAVKHREDKPFALMAPDLGVVQALCPIGRAERDLLTSPECPIVLMPRRPTAPVAPAVAPATGELGIMLPYTPFHHLLLAHLGRAVVCTSGNVSDEPIAYRDDDAVDRLTPLADLVVTHDRPIHIRVDDSVTRVVDGAPYPIRRSRGYAPAPVTVPWPARRPILACGAELKNTIALARDRQVFLSHHIGDLKTMEAAQAFVEAIGHLSHLFQIEPEVVAHDLHPDYRSSRYAATLDGLDRIAVQHHHAHVAACLGDTGRDGPVIGVAFDGMGLGDDGTVWGGEFLVADRQRYRRAGWFRPVPLPGGDAATREPWRMAAVHLDAASARGGPGPDHLAGLAVAGRNERWGDIVALGRSGLRSPPTSSVGRLFDAVAAVLDVRDTVNYEGQAAIELEQLVDPAETGAHRAGIVSSGGTHIVEGSDLVAAAVADVLAGVDRARIAARFHAGLVDVIETVCRRLRDETGLGQVALTGGVFLNTTLLVPAIRRLRAAGFEVLRHQRVPCNDGGISLGQTVVAAARDGDGGPAQPGRLS